MLLLLQPFVSSQGPDLDRGPTVAEVQPGARAARVIPAWDPAVGRPSLAQSSSGPSFGIGSSAGPVAGNINPYTATPGAETTSAPASPASGSGAAAGAGNIIGTQQEQGGGAGAMSSGAASPSSSNGTSPVARSAATGRVAGSGGAGGDEAAPGLGKTGGRLMDTGGSIGTPPPPSLTDTDRSAAASPKTVAGKPSSKAHPGDAKTKKAVPPTPPSPIETGSSSTR